MPADQPQVKIKRANPRIALPRYESGGAAGMDLRAFLDHEITIRPLAREKITTGLSFEIPPGYEGQVRPRSGLALKSGLTVLNSPGTVDSDYRGEVQVILVNFGDEDVKIRDGDRVAQLVISPVCRARLEETCELSFTERGSGAFGSTGQAGQ